MTENKAILMCMLLAALIAFLVMHGCASTSSAGCDIEQSLLESVESELGVTCADVRPEDDESLCTGGVAVGLDRAGRTARVWTRTDHYPSAYWGRIVCVDDCGGCDVIRGGSR